MEHVLGSAAIAGILLFGVLWTRFLWRRYAIKGGETMLVLTSKEPQAWITITHAGETMRVKAAEREGDGIHLIFDDPSLKFSIVREGAVKRKEATNE